MKILHITYWSRTTGVRIDRCGRARPVAEKRIAEPKVAENR